MEEKRSKSTVAMAKDRKSLNDIEDRILQLLSESTGNVLDDENLIDTLEESKYISAGPSLRSHAGQASAVPGDDERKKWNIVQSLSSFDGRSDNTRASPSFPALASRASFPLPRQAELPLRPVAQSHQQAAAARQASQPQAYQ